MIAMEKLAMTVAGIGQTAWPSMSAALIAVSVSACSGQGTTQTGFLSSYADMHPTQGHTDDLIFVDPAYKREDYAKVIIDPVVWSPATGMPARDPAVIDELKVAFSKSLIENIGKDFAIIEAQSASDPGPGVLRVRSAITNTRRANWWINAPVQVAGIGLAVVGLPGGVPPPDPGGASEEMEVIDAHTGKRLIAIATYNNGVPWAPLGYYQAFGHARRAFAIGAALLREQMRTGETAVASRP